MKEFRQGADSAGSAGFDSKKMRLGLKRATSKERWINYFVLFFAIYFVWNAGVAVRHNAKLEAKLSSLEQKALLLEESSKNLGLQKTYFGSREYQEKALKNNFNLVAAGEGVVVVKDLPAAKNSRGNVFSELQDMYKLLNE